MALYLVLTIIVITSSPLILLFPIVMFGIYLVYKKTEYHLTINDKFLNLDHFYLFGLFTSHSVNLTKIQEIEFVSADTPRLLLHLEDEDSVEIGKNYPELDLLLLRQLIEKQLQTK